MPMDNVSRPDWGPGGAPDAPTPSTAVATLGGVDRPNFAEQYNPDGSERDATAGDVQLPIAKPEVTAAMLEYPSSLVQRWNETGGFELHEQRVQETRRAVGVRDAARIPREFCGDL